MTESWKSYQKLHTKKYRRDRGLFLAEGVRLCQEAVRSGWEIVAAFFNQDFTASSHYPAIAEQFHQSGLEPTILADSSFKRLAQTEHPQGIILILKIPPSPAEIVLKDQRIILILDGIRDPGNLGTIIRTADWFGVTQIVASADNAEFFNPKVVRASMGSIFHLPLMEHHDVPALVRSLKLQGCQVFATSLRAKNIPETTRLTPPIALILGSEAEGVSPSLKNAANTTIRIPRRGQAESLNVAVAGGILLDWISRSLLLKDMANG